MTTKLFFAKFAFAIKRLSRLRNFVFTGVLAIFVGSCATQDAVKVPVAAAPVAALPKPTALTDEADKILKAAEQNVTEARIKRALWTAAVEELKLAQGAAKNFDSVATLAHAREVIALCGHSIAQLSSAPVKW